MLTGLYTQGKLLSPNAAIKLAQDYFCVRVIYQMPTAELICSIVYTHSFVQISVRHFHVYLIQYRYQQLI